MKRPTHNPRAPRAFTMLEMLLAMAMVAMLSLTLYTSFRVAIAARRSAADSVTAIRTASIAIDLATRDLEAALPPGDGTTGNLVGPFLGLPQQGLGGDEMDMIEFYCVGGDLLGEDGPFSEGVRLVELGVNTDVSPPALVRRVTRNLLAPVQTGPEEEVLCRGVRSFVLRYYDGVAWQNQWDSTAYDNTLPLTVEMTIEVEDPRRIAENGIDRGTYRITRLIHLACAPPPGAI